VVSLRDSLIAAETSGKVVWVADVGAEIEEGGVVARLDPQNARFARDESAAEAKRLTARADYLARLYERFAGLGEESGESDATIDEMRANRDEARQNLARARAALKRADADLERTEIRAPFAGRVAAQEIQIGEYASPGSAVARLVDVKNLEVTAQAPAALLRNVKAGDEIRLVQGAESQNARVRAIVPVGDEVSRTLELRLALPDSDWHIGSAVRVRLPASEPKPVVAAHRDALVLRADRVSVFAVDAEMVAHQIDVELGAADGELVEIIGPVKAGDKLVVRGGERLRDGQKVTIAEDRAASSAS
jgi:RND family efflux transporter MFP subunit